MEAKKVIVATDKEYTDEFEPLIEELYNRKIELFCAWGTHCCQWETAMDLYITDPDRKNEIHYIATTSHEDEPFEDVLNMAELWEVENSSNEVETIRLLQVTMVPSQAFRSYFHPTWFHFSPSYLR